MAKMMEGKVIHREQFNDFVEFYEEMAPTLVGNRRLLPFPLEKGKLREVS